MLVTVQDKSKVGGIGFGMVGMPQGGNFTFESYQCLDLECISGNGFPVRDCSGEI